MAIETLANLQVYDTTWKYPTGTDKGVSVFDTTWKIVKEIYVRDGGSWKYVHPVRAGATILLGSDGVCDSSNATNAIRMRMDGPLPQVTAGTGHYYFWKWYWRNSTVSAVHILTLGWGFQGSSTGITASIVVSPNSGQGYVREAGTANRWTQMQCRLNHSVYGEMTEAEGGIATTIVKGSKTKDCGGPE